MANNFSVKNIEKVTQQLTASLGRAEQAAVYALGQVALVIERDAKKNASTGQHKRGEGHIPGTGPGPNIVTGALRRSIQTTMTRKGFGTYTAEVYPTMIYARAVELGNPNWKSGVKYPYLIPAGKNVAKRANSIFTFNFRKRWKS